MAPTGPPGPHDDLNSPTPAFPAALQERTFGLNNNAPFLFQAPTPHMPHIHAWVPPQNFSPAKAFPQPQLQESKDAGISKPNPLKPAEIGTEGARPVANGALRRVFKWRGKPQNERSVVIQLADVSGSQSDLLAPYILSESVLSNCCIETSSHRLQISPIHRHALLGSSVSLPRAAIHFDSTTRCRTTHL